MYPMYTEEQCRSVGYEGDMEAIASFISFKNAAYILKADKLADWMIAHLSAVDLCLVIKTLAKLDLAA